MNRISKPMGREDWAWILTCFICGTLFALLSLAIEKGDEQDRQLHGRRISFYTKGDVQKIIYAVKSAAPESELVPYSTTPPYSFFTDWFAGVWGILMISLLFRILEKLCGRLLGVKPHVEASLANPK